MIKNFKKFNKINESYASELIDEVDDNYIYDYYDKNSYWDFDEIISMFPSIVKDHIDDERYVQDWIDSDIENNSFEEYSDWDFKEYIKKFLTDKKENKILELYNDNNYDEDDEDDEKTTEFDIDQLEDLDDDQLKEVIEEDDDESEFVSYMAHQRYDGMSAMDIIEEIYGDLEEQEKNSSYHKYGYGQKPHTLYDEVKNYVDEDAVVKAFKDDTDFTTQKEYVQEEIYRDKDIQRHILKNDSKNALNLAELFEEENDDNIGDEFEFQEAYVKHYEIENNDYDEGDEEYEEEKSLQIETALEYIDDNFEIDDRFKDIYPKEMKDILIKHDTQKYNL